MMKPHWPNFPRLIQSVLEEGAFPGTTVIADLDSNSYEEVPLISWGMVNEGQVDYGVWSLLVSMSLIIDPFQMNSILPHVYAQIQSWNEPGVGVLADEQFGIESVEDQTVLNPKNSAIVNGKHLAEFDSQFRLIVRDWS